MKVVQASPAYEGGRANEKSVQSSYDETEERLILRFETGKDFNDFDGFIELFLSILKSADREWGERQTDRLRQMGMEKNLSDYDMQGIDIGIPIARLNLDRIKELT